MTTRQLSRLFHEAADAAGIKKSVTLQRCATALRPPARSRHRYQKDRGAAGSQQIGHHGALHARRHRHDRRHREPLDLLAQPRKKPNKHRKVQRGVTAAAVSRPALEVADIFRDHGAAWRRANAGHVSLDQMKVMSAIERCRTAALAAMSRVARSARTRSSPITAAVTALPKCQGAAAKEWLAAREAELLPVPYFHVVYTLPGAIRDIAYQNKAVIYDLLFKAAAEATLTIAADPKRLGARIAITAVLHSWGSAMTHHPHVHMVVPGGGLSPDASKWIACRPRYFLPVEVLSALFRRLFLEMLVAAHDHCSFRRSCAAHGQGCIRCLSEATARDRLGGLRRRAFAGPSKCCAICRAIPTASPSPIAGWCPRARTASLSSTRTIGSRGQAATRR